MKRPQGFDPPARGTVPKRDRVDAARGSGKTAPHPALPAPAPAPASPGASSPADPPGTAASPRTRSRADGARQLRQAAAARRRAERAEVRRFTRRSRRRRIVWLVVAGMTVTLLTGVAVAVFSPLMALRSIQIEGTERIDPAQVRDALDEELGTPLALVDPETIRGELQRFPLIRSYITRLVPPDTLVIRITERQPVAAVNTGTAFESVDPAGVVVQVSDTRPEGLPVADLGGQDLEGPAFRSVAEVLLTLPEHLRAEVDSVAARTRDDVTLTLLGVGQEVQWGSADQSEQKARVLAALIAVTDPNQAGVFDVSAPSIAVFKPE